MDQSKGLTRTLRVLRETALVQLSQSATAAYMLLVREADLLSTFNIVWDMSYVRGPLIHDSEARSRAPERPCSRSNITT